MGQSETATDDAAISEQAAQLIGLRAGRHIEVLWLATQQQITHAAADQIGLMFGLVETLDYLGGIGIDLVRPDLHPVTRSMAYSFGQDWRRGAPMGEGAELDI
jgi:hypothetical protein